MGAIPDQLPQTRLRLGPHPPGPQAAGSDLGRARGIHSQPGQDRVPGQLTRHSPAPARHPRPRPHYYDDFSGRSNLRHALFGGPAGRRRPEVSLNRPAGPENGGTTRVPGRRCAPSNAPESGGNSRAINLFVPFEL